jgi:uncharacterized protein
VNAPLVAVIEGALGKGVHALREFRAGGTILTFDGPELSHDEVLGLGEAQAYTIQIGPDRYIDTLFPGRFTNHSCDPNAGIWQDRYLVAIRPIAVGEQIQFDYSTTMSENHWTMQCRCGSAKCRGLIRDFHLLPVPLQVHYLRLGIVQQFIVRECHRRIRGVTPIGRAPRELRARRAV